MLECRLEGARVAIGDASKLDMVLPHGSGFYRARLGRDTQSGMEGAEKAENKKAR